MYDMAIYEALRAGEFELLIKLDRGPVRELRPDLTPPQWIGGLRALIGAAHVTVVAEGVEDEYQRRALVDAGISLAQGHLFSEALPATQFKTYFAQAGALS